MKHPTPTLRKRLTALIVSALLSSPALAAPDPQPSPTPAGGIRTDFGDVLIEILGIGQTYNLRDLAGTPLKVTNTGASTINLVLDVQIPKDSFITPLRKEAGFHPIPSIDWVTLSQSQFLVPAGESAYTDVIIKIPNDPALYGKKFQASIYSRTIGTNFLQLGVWSHLQMTIVPSPEAQAEMERNRKHGIVGNMDYTLLPDKLVILNIPLGRPVDVKKELKKTMMLANSGSDPIRLRLKVVQVGGSPLSLQSGYEEPADLNWLKIASPEVEVDGASFADPGLTLTLPNDPKLHGKKLMFIVKVEPADPEVVGVTYYGKIYVDIP
jgi:hypothetical protein